MTDRLRGRKLLALFPADHFAPRFTAFREYFGEIRLFNYTDHSLRHGIKKTEHRITGIVSEDKTDLLLYAPFTSDYQLSVEFLDSLRNRVKTVFWLADDGAYFESYGSYYAQAADLVITSEHFAVSAYGRLGIKAVLCRETNCQYTPAPVKIEKDTDVCFIGDMRKQGRQEYVDFLRSSGINVATYGLGSGVEYIPFGKMSEHFCKTRINLNFSGISRPDWMNSEEPLLNRVRQDNGRPLELALAGAFCLSEDSPGLAADFEEGREIAVFRTKEELLGKVRRYLADPAEREAMAAAAHARAMKNYHPDIWRPRLVDQIFENLYGTEARLRRRDGIFLNPGFKARSVNSLTFSMLLMLRGLNFRHAAETFFLLFARGPAAFFRGFCGGLLRGLRLLLAKKAVDTGAGAQPHSEVRRSAS